MKLNISELASICGLHRSTVRARLRELQPDEKRGSGGAKMFDSVTALAAIYADHPAGDLDLQQERAHLAAMQAARVDLDVKRLEAELVSAEDVVEAWSRMAEYVEAELAPLPAALAHAAMGAMTIKEIETTTRAMVHDLLTRLSKMENFPE